MTRLGVGLILLALAGCAPESQGVTLVRSVGPGAEAVNAETAVSLFSSVCVRSGGRHTVMQRILNDEPVLLETETGVYFHQVYDASYKAVFDEGDQACSFVARVTGNASAIADRLERQATGAGLSARSRTDRLSDGRRVVVARAISE